MKYLGEIMGCFACDVKIAPQNRSDIAASTETVILIGPLEMKRDWESTARLGTSDPLKVHFL